MRRSPLILLLPALLLAVPATAQTPDTTQRAHATTVDGVVHDSIAGRPLGGAIVQLVGADDPTALVRSAIADSMGRFAWDGVPEGRYLIGFMHAMLDSIGIALPLRQVHVVGGDGAVRADLAVPGAERIGIALCGSQFASDSMGVVAGFVHDAQSRMPASGANVTGEWHQLEMRPEGIFQRAERVSAMVAENGSFILCGVPRDATIGLRAGRDADSTALVEVTVPLHGLARRALYVGAAHTVVTTDSIAPVADDSLAAGTRRLQVGTGRLTGIVVTAAKGRPLSDALVGIVDGPHVRTNERGEWTITDAPSGTRMLEVRALGYYPERRPVNVVPEMAPVHVALSTFKSVMDTVKVTASRLYDRDSNGFQRRRRAGMGRYITPEDIARRRPINTTDLFWNVPSVQLSSGGWSGRSITMRGGNVGRCTPAIFIDGMRIDDMTAKDVGLWRRPSGVTAEEIDSWVRPGDVKGIEIYTTSSAPMQYRTLNGCGSILIWTR